MPHSQRSARTKVSTAATTGQNIVTKNETTGAITKANAIGIGDRDRLGQNFGENDDQHGHDRRRIDSAAIAGEDDAARWSRTRRRRY